MREVRLAINVFDLQRLAPAARASLLKGKMDEQAGTVRPDGGDVDEVGVMFRCGLLTAATVCEIVRGYDRKAGDRPARVYVRRAGRWSRLAADAALTLQSSAGLILNPALFPAAAAPVRAPAAPIRVRMGS